MAGLPLWRIIQTQKGQLNLHWVSWYGVHFLISWLKLRGVEFWFFHGLTGMYWLENIQDRALFNSPVTPKPGGLHSTLVQAELT